MASEIGRELKLASQFVRQYYTILNKAPNYIHHFYNHDSTFIHGTIEMGSEHHTQPVVGREQIENKVKELGLNDCRAKIEQIDCLQTLAGGLVIQVIGELSNNGRPMRRFLQTFVLAPCHKDQRARQDGDQLSVSELALGSQQSSSQVNQKPKFYVLNSIFRYQDDGQDSEFEDDTISVHANTSTNNASNAAGQNGNDEDHEQEGINNVKQTTIVTTSSSEQQQPQIPCQAAQPATAPNNTADALPKHQQPPQSSEKVLKMLTPQQNATESANPNHKQAENLATNIKASPAHSTSNNGCTDKKTDVPEKSTENKKSAGGVSSGEQTKTSYATSAATSADQSAPATAPNTGNTGPASPPAPKSNEPKTWANIISRNAHPTPPQPVVASAPSNVAKNASSEQQHSQATTTQATPQIPHHQDQSSHHQQQQHQSNQLQQIQNQQMDAQRGQNNNNNRRRNMIRKTSNKPPGGRPMKDRPRPTGKPVA